MHHIFLKCGLSSFASASSAPSRRRETPHSPEPPCGPPTAATSSAPALPAAGCRPERSAALRPHRPVCADKAALADAGSKRLPVSLRQSAGELAQWDRREVGGVELGMAYRSDVSGGR